MCHRGVLAYQASGTSQMSFLQLGLDHDTARMRNLAAKQQAEGKGLASLISPLLSPLALHTAQDAETRAEQSKLNDETRMEHRLADEMQRVSAGQRA